MKGGDAGAVPAADAGAVCGDGVVAGELEECDGKDLAGDSCFGLGFFEGQLKCSAECRFDSSGCVGTERCEDGRDNDGDGLADCSDPDCEAQCASGCGSPVPLIAESSVWPGNNLGHADEVMSGCASGTSGPEVVYEFIPPRDGVLQASLQSNRLLTLSVLRECAPGSIGVQAECVSPNRQLVVPVTANEPVFVVVEGRDVSAVGPYKLTATFREIVCGDGTRDQGEGCDDGNQQSGDGCSASCGVELSEVEPNDVVEQASPLTNPFWGEIALAGDVDYIHLDLATDVAELQISVESLGDGACALNLLDSVLRVFDHEGDELAFDDDGGSGFCSRVLMRNISAGRYAVRVEAAMGAQWPTFPYSLKVVH